MGVIIRGEHIDKVPQTYKVVSEYQGMRFTKTPFILDGVNWFYWDSSATSYVVKIRVTKEGKYKTVVSYDNVNGNTMHDVSTIDFSLFELRNLVVCFSILTQDGTRVYMQGDINNYTNVFSITREEDATYGYIVFTINLSQNITTYNGVGYPIERFCGFTNADVFYNGELFLDGYPYLFFEASGNRPTGDNSIQIECYDFATSFVEYSEEVLQTLGTGEEITEFTAETTEKFLSNDSSTPTYYGVFHPYYFMVRPKSSGDGYTGYATRGQIDIENKKTSGVIKYE